jgi:hypothetical protein
MLTTKMKSIVSVRDSVEGLKETVTEMAIGTNEALDEVPERLAEVEAIVDALLVSDEKFKSMDIYQQAEYLELNMIFGFTTIQSDIRNCHFARQGYLDLLIAKRDGKLEDVKAVAVQAKLDRDAAEKPVDGKPGKIVTEEPVG